MTKDLTSGSPAKLILGFALPLLTGMLFQQLYNFVDAMIVGRFLGVTALAGVGATGSINFLVLGFCMGICSGFAIPVAQYFGARDESRMRHYVTNGMWLSMGFVAVITVATVVFCKKILVMMDTPQDCMKEAYTYIVVVFAGIPFIFLYNLLSGYLRSLGDSKTPLFFLILSSVLNVALDLVFILALHMGVFGAALATVISQGVSGLLCLLYIGRRVPVLHITGDEWKPGVKEMLDLCRYGVPMGMQYSVTAVGSVVLQTAINSLGAAAVAAVAASGKVLGFLGCPFEALGATMATYSAQNIGANRYDRLSKGLWASILMGFAYSCC
ncbi:MAG: MATE family efflux transporter [Clostridia bacterium]|nr:MATE family efflux transporter [Clostridia bacterium]